MAENFYNVAERIDKLKALDRPTQTNIEELIQYLDDDGYVRYFFHDLNNPAWVEPLHHLGWFSKVPPPMEDKNQPGYFSMPFWQEGAYLSRMAEYFPSIVKDVALSLNTENSRAIQIMLEALLKTPADIVAETTGKFRRWAETPFVNFMTLAHDLGNVLEYLAKSGQIEAALTVLDVLLEPVQVKDRFEEGKFVSSSRHDYYWLNEALQKNLPSLTKIDPIGVVTISESQLIKAINLEHDPRIDDAAQKKISYWRLNISPRSDENYDNEIKNLLVNTIINALNIACEQKALEVDEILTRYIESDYSIFRRISLFMLRTWGRQHKDLLERSYNKQKMDPMRGRSEFDRFVEIQFENLPEWIQKDIVHERMNPNSEWVEELVKNRPESFAGETVEEKRQTVTERLQFEDLAPLASYLKAGDKEYYEYLQNKHGKPTQRPESGVTISSWEGPESPIEIEQLAKKSVEEVVEDLLNYVPQSGEPFGIPSREGMARTLEIDVQARARDYASNATLFINKALPFVYHTHLLRGLENAIKNKEKIILTEVILVCEYITGQETDQFIRQESEPGLPAAKLAIVHLFEELFRVKEPDLDDDLVEKSGELIVTLLHQEEPFPEDEDGENYDPATHSLNCLHGVAMHSLVSFGLYCERKRQKEMGHTGRPIMVPLMKETLTEKLDKESYPSLAVHSVFGWYYPQFIYLDREWTLANREKIFPVEATLDKYWQAAWSAYIRFSDVYTNVFPDLIKEYQRAFEDFSAVGNQEFDRTDERLATHILKAYLLDMINIDSQDRLVRLYYQKASDETRSRGNFWLSQVLGSQKPSAEDRVWQKIWSLWQWRIEDASVSDNQRPFTKEIASFCRFLKNTPLELPKLYSTLQRMLGFEIEAFEIGLIIEYLGANSEKHPDLAVRMLHEIVSTERSFYLVTDTEKSVEQIFTAAIYAGKEAKAKAIEIINIFGERGDYKWRPFLAKINEIA